MGNETESEPSSSVPYGILENGATFADLESGDRPPAAASGQRETENSYHHGEDCSVITAAAADMEQVKTDETRFAKRSPVEEEEEEEHKNQDEQQRQQQNLAKRNPRPQSVRMLSKKLVLVNVLANFLMFAIAGFITYHCFNKATVLFSWHPTFMAAGYLVLMSQAVLTLSGANLLTYQRHHKTRVLIHWLLQALAGVLITIAFVCIVLNKIRMGKAHFQTTHGLFGLITVVLTLVSIGGGVFTKYGYQLRSMVRPIYSKIMHGIAGTVTYILGSVTIGLGIYSRWFEEDNGEQVRLALLIGLIAVTLYVIINPITATISRTKTALRTTL
uniref:ascorbate ferrireductase (transmembrane) n=1 Tax=Culex tarsalis TaxID=7177 RepID=A0A1Q3F7E3_CULTA